MRENISRLEGMHILKCDRHCQTSRTKPQLALSLEDWKINVCLHETHYLFIATPDLLQHSDQNRQTAHKSFLDNIIPHDVTEFCSDVLSIHKNTKKHTNTETPACTLEND